MKKNNSVSFLHVCLFILLCFAQFSSSQKTCPNCGSMEVPYPLSTSSNCGDPDYGLRCDAHTHKLYLAGGMPSAYKIRLHASGCKAFRSILHLDPEQPANKWEEGLEIQWRPPPEPVCHTKFDCSGASSCLATIESGMSRCLCIRGYYWDHAAGT